jgi:hypothetical protein
MPNENPVAIATQHTRPELPDQTGERLWEDQEEWEEPGPASLWDELWDAFERDDEMAEPQPEDGDFWGRPDIEQEEG